MKTEKRQTQREKAHKAELQDWYLTLVALLANSPNEIPRDRRSTTMKDMALKTYMVLDAPYLQCEQNVGCLR